MRITLTPPTACVALMGLLIGCGGNSGDAPTAPVQPAAVATVTISGIVPLKVGQTAQLTAVPHDAAGNSLSGRPVSWNSTLPSVASVSDNGLVTGISPGSATITASIEGKNGTDSILVSSTVPVATVTAPFSAITMALREVLSVTLTARDSAGNMLVGHAATWTSSNQAIVTIQADGSLRAIATGSAIVTGSIEGVSASVPVRVIAFASITALTTDICALTSSGVMYCAGTRFGSGARPVSPELRWTQVDEASGDDGAHICGVTTDGNVRCWGANGFGELGVGDHLDRDEPALVRIPERVNRVSTGSQHTCALTVVGNIYCWGGNSFGQLGDGDAYEQTTPVQVASSETFTQVSAGGLHTCGLTTHGAILCWGRNRLGEIGRGTWSATDAFAIPMEVKGNLHFKSVSLSASHSCGLTTGGQAYCWGANTVFELGQVSSQLCDGEHPCLTAPSAVTTSVAFDIIAASAFGGCGLTSAGTTHCWGMDAQSMLGVASGSVPPCQVLGTVRGCTSNPLPGPIDFKTLTGSFPNYCGMRFDGGAYCWGGNRAGQLGIPSPDESAVPLAVAIDPGVIPP